mgnify:CR=1 FL=1
MNIDLKGKTALITGSSEGIGLEIAKCLSNEGCMVAINGRNKRKLFKASKLVSGSFPIQGDVTNYKIAKRVISGNRLFIKNISINKVKSGAVVPNRVALEILVSLTAEKKKAK